jgi:hypothetical protein
MHWLADLFTGIVLEYGVKAPGYIICRLFWKREDLHVEQLKVALTGLVFWAFVIVGCYVAYGHLAEVGA